MGTHTWGPFEGHHVYLRTSLLSTVLTPFASVREASHFLKLWILPLVPWTTGVVFRNGQSAERRALSLGMLFSFRIMTFLIFSIQCRFLPHVPFMVLPPSGFSEHGVAVISGYEVQLFQVVPV